ncbi:MAG: 4Fe-4S cluster-binding domain-containing protein [Prevotellaceae bacterium]|jgi:uncharacterized protein|nr:4Fe-4S cluster-binding domain-containing protein [Prevotellaceae bacterium]
MHKYKLSIFNLIVELSDNDVLLYNTFSRSLIKIRKEDFQHYAKVFTELQELDNQELKEIKNSFINFGFIVEKDFNEATYIKIRNRQWRHTPLLHSIAIIPNMDCNFNCKYCFEQTSHNYMSKKIIKSIEAYINRNLESQNIKSLAVSWYGGEPLLSPNIIERLSKTFSQVENYKAFIFTNGYAFNGNFIEKLKIMGIKLIVITLDGSKDSHDKYRYLKNGKGTYNKILENISKICQTHNDEIKFNIRTNFDKNNIDFYESMLEDFEKINIKNISFIFSKITKSISGNGANVTNILSEKELNTISYKIRELLVKHNFYKPLDFLPTKLDYFNCYTGADNGFAINYDGAVYKCFGDVNPPQNQVGNLLENGEIEYFPKEIIKWYGYDFFDNSKCRNCVILPSCMGGCAKARLGLDIYNSPKCNQNKMIDNTKAQIKQAYFLQKSNKK